MTQAQNVAVESSQINSSGVLQPAGGGTGATTTAAAYNALTPLTTTGDIVYEASASTAARLPIGTTGQVLTVVGGIPSWATASSGFSGATVTSSGVDITLTTSSNQLQQVAMTAQNLRVILPDATTVTTLGGSKFIINNNGAYPFDISVTGGGRLFVLSPGQTTQIGLSNNSAASTGWIATPVKSPVSTFPGQMIGSTDLITYEPTNITSAAASSGVINYASCMRCCALSSTSVLVAYIAPTTSYPTAVVGTISGTTITWGTPTTIVATANNTVYVTNLSSTTAMMFYNNGTNSVAKGLAISGTTITASTASASVGYVTCISPLASTTAIFGYVDGSNCVARVVTYNGASAPTFGTAVAVVGATGGNINLIALSATAYVAMVQDDNVVIYFRAGSISGTTITQGTIVTATNMPGVFLGATSLAVSATQALFLSINGLQTLVTISGTTISSQAIVYAPNGQANVSLNMLANNQNLSNISNFYIPNNVNYYTPFIAKLSSTDALIVGSGTSGSTNMGVQRVSYNTTTLAVGKGFSITTNMAMTRDVCPLTSTTAFICGLRSDVGAPPTLYPTGQIVALNG